MGCGLHTRPFVHGVVKQVFLKSIQFWCPDFPLQTTAWLLSKHSPAIEVYLIIIQTSTFSLRLWASTMKTTVVSRKNSRNVIKDMLLKGTLSIRFWQVYNKWLQTNNIYARVIFLSFLLFSQNHARKLGQSFVVHKCGLYSIYLSSNPLPAHISPSLPFNPVSARLSTKF